MTFRERVEENTGLWPLPVTTAARSIGVELRGEDGQPFHCGERMATYEGILGTDSAECRRCHAKMWRIDSPHTNGGLCLNQKTVDEMGDNVWIAKAGTVLP